jgi:FkbM family methyltransferase
MRHEVRTGGRRKIERPGRLNKPQYIWHPLRSATNRLRGAGRTRLPWGLTLAYGPSGPMGKSLSRSGVYDLAISETVFRLLVDGDTAIDGGANVGYMASVMAARVGERGHVVAFEPQPEIFGRLQRNIAAWHTGSVDARNVALSSRGGVAKMAIPTDRDANHERASLRELKAAHVTIEVATMRLDDASLPTGPIALVKLDVEGHESEVLRGGREALGSVGNVVMEEHQEIPTEASELLVELGFQLYTVHESFTGPRLRELAAGVPHLGWGPPNIVATRTPERLQAAFREAGWLCLRRARLATARRRAAV